MGKGWPRWLLPPLLLSSTLGAAAPTPYWVCVGADGTKVAQDHPCEDAQTTLRHPPGMPAAMPSHRVQPARNPPPDQATTGASADGPARVATSSSSSANAPAGMYQPIVDVATRGFAYIALIVVAIFAVRALLIRGRRRPGRASDPR